MKTTMTLRHDSEKRPQTNSITAIPAMLMTMILPVYVGILSVYVGIQETHTGTRIVPATLEEFSDG